MKKFGVIDLIIILAIIATLVVGYLTYKHFRQTADNQIESTSKIAFEVFLRGVTITGSDNPIKVGDETFISIRNVPYTNLKVVGVRADSKKTLMPNPMKKPAFLIVDDYSQLYLYDIIVTVVDTAKITKDGAVVGGNKIKIGLPITLEGKNYKFNGTVSNLQFINDNQLQPSADKPGQPQSGVQPQSKGSEQPNAQQQAASEQSQSQTKAPVSQVQPQQPTPVNTPVGIKK